MTHVNASPNGCVWPKCQSTSRVADLIPPSPEFVMGVRICVEHREFINTLFFLMRLQISQEKGDRPLQLDT